MAELNIKIYFVWYGKDFCELDLWANMYNTTFKECVSQCNILAILTKIKSYPFML